MLHLSIDGFHSGAAALSMPASDESIHFWATANSTNGPAIQTAPSRAIAGQSVRATLRRAAGTTASVAVPNAGRSSATSPVAT